MPSRESIESMLTDPSQPDNGGTAARSSSEVSNWDGFEPKYRDRVLRSHVVPFLDQLWRAEEKTKKLGQAARDEEDVITQMVFERVFKHLSLDSQRNQLEPVYHSLTAGLALRKPRGLLAVKNLVLNIKDSVVGLMIRDNVDVAKQVTDCLAQYKREGVEYLKSYQSTNPAAYAEIVINEFGVDANFLMNRIIKAAKTRCGLPVEASMEQLAGELGPDNTKKLLTHLENTLNKVRERFAELRGMSSQQLSQLSLTADDDDLKRMDWYDRAQALKEFYPQVYMQQQREQAKETVPRKLWIESKMASRQMIKVRDEMSK